MYHQNKLHKFASPQNKIQKDLMDKVKWNVNRESPKERQKDFLDWLKVVQETIYHVCVWG